MKWDPSYSVPNTAHTSFQREELLLIIFLSKCSTKVLGSNIIFSTVEIWRFHLSFSYSLLLAVNKSLAIFFVSYCLTFLSWFDFSYATLLLLILTAMTDQFVTVDIIIIPVIDVQTRLINMIVYILIVFYVFQHTFF